MLLHGQWQDVGMGCRSKAGQEMADGAGRGGAAEAHTLLPSMPVSFILS